MARFLDRFRRTETRSALDNPGLGWAPLDWAAHGVHSPHQAEGLATVSACIASISSGLASMPIRVYETTPAGRLEAPLHPISALLRRPNSWMSLPSLVEFLVSQTLGWGNGLIELRYDPATGAVTDLIPVPWFSVRVVMLDTGRVAFDISSTGATQPPTRRVLQENTIWLRDRTDDGIVGRSRLSRAHGVVAAAIGAQEHSAELWRNYASPSGAIKMPCSLQPEQYKRIRASVDANVTGTHNAAKVMILDGGAEFQPISMSPEDSELLASRRFSGEELARIFQVPPPIVGDLSHGTFQNVEQATRTFAVFCLAPWATKLTAELNAALFAPDDPYDLVIDMSALTRADDAARWASYAIAIQNGVLDAAEVRELEGWNPRPAATPANDPTPTVG